MALKTGGNDLFLQKAETVSCGLPLMNGGLKKQRQANALLIIIAFRRLVETPLTELGYGACFKPSLYSNIVMWFLN